MAGSGTLAQPKFPSAGFGATQYDCVSSNTGFAARPP
jgi:hypothetical protein